MKKILVTLLLFITSLAYSQNAAKLEGIWVNQEGEVLEMGWKVWTRKTKQGEELASGTWEEVSSNTLHIKRYSGEEYDISFGLSKTNTTWAIEQPFSDVCWIWFRIQ